MYMCIYIYIYIYIHCSLLIKVSLIIDWTVNQSISMYTRQNNFSAFPIILSAKLVPNLMATSSHS